MHLAASSVAGRTRSVMSRIAETKARTGRAWQTRLTLAPSRIRNVVTGLPAGYGLFAACPACPVRHHPVPRRHGEDDAAYWARVDALCACPHGPKGPKHLHDAVAIEKGAFVGRYRGLRGPADAEGDYVLQVDAAFLGIEAAPFTLDAFGNHGSLLRYCNGVEDATNPRCNLQLPPASDHPVVLNCDFGHASIPVVALRDIRYHDELYLPYGKAYFRTLDAKKFIFT